MGTIVQMTSQLRAGPGTVELVREVYENQRYLGPLGWKPPPAALDRAGWTDARGEEVAFAEGRCPAEQPDAWQSVASPSTDDEGWQYGTVFSHLENRRAGGRASQRFGDLVRRRLWRKRDASGAPDAAVLGGAPGSEAAGPALADAARNAGYESEAQKRAIRAFLGMIFDLFSRRQLWTLLPWDLSAPFVLYRKHREVYRSLRAAAAQRRLFAAGEQAPPSPLGVPGRTLLQDLLCAAMHARAAYGFAAAAGHMSSVSKAVSMLTVHQFTAGFDAVGGVSAEANNEALAGLAGIDPGDILEARWRNSTYRPCHYVAIDRSNSCIVLAIRGSLQIGDLLSDLTAQPMELELGGADGWVHAGLLQAATYVHCATRAALERAAEECPGWPVLVTGHSLGGGVAALLAMLLREAGLPPGLGPLHCVAVGPAAVMSEPLAAACEPLVTSVIVGSDVIPHLSQASVEELLLEASAASPVRQTVEGLGRKLTSALGMTPAAGWAAVRGASEQQQGGSSGQRGLGRVLSMLDDDGGRGRPPPGQGAGPQATQAGPRTIPIIQEPPPGAQQGEAGAEVDLAEEDAGPAEDEEEEEEQGGSLLYASGMDVDTFGLGAGVARESASSLAGSAASTSGGAAGPGKPELLYPPGRLIWIFPAAEEEGGGTEAEEAEPGGKASGAPVPAPGAQGEAVSMVQAVEQVEAEEGGEAGSGGGSGGGSGPPPTAAPVVADAERSSFERLLMLPDMMSDHLPDAYLAAIQQL